MSSWHADGVAPAIARGSNHAKVVAMRIFALTLAISGLPSVAVAAPPAVDGAYRLVSISNGKQTVVWQDLFAKAKQRGEIVLSFADGKVSLGLWSLAKVKDEKRPEDTLLAFCRGQASYTPAWTAKGFTLPATLGSEGWANAYLVSTKKKGATTTTNTWHGNSKCSFSLEKADYAVTVTESGPDGPLKLTINNGKGTMTLERTTPIAEVKTDEIVKAFLAE